MFTYTGILKTIAEQVHFAELSSLHTSWVMAAPMSTWLKEHLGWKMQTVQRAKIPARGLLVAEGEEPDWEARFPTGFVTLPRRWVVERTNAWITHSRRLSRDFEDTHSSSESLIYLAMSRLMATRLGRVCKSA